MNCLLRLHDHFFLNVSLKQYIIYFCTFYASHIVELLPGRDLEIGRFILVRHIYQDKCWFFFFQLYILAVYYEVDVSGFQWDCAVLINVGEMVSFMKMLLDFFFIVESILSFQICWKSVNIISIVRWYQLFLHKRIRANFSIQILFLPQKLQLRLRFISWDSFLIEKIQLLKSLCRDSLLFISCGF